MRSLLDGTTGDLLDEAARAAGYEPQPPLPIPTVLLVEDDAVSARVTNAQLKRVGARVLLAKNASDALLMFEDVQPDVVIVDVNVPRQEGSLPEPLGSEIVASIRDMQSDTHPYVIVLTGTASEPERLACMRAGADDVYLKTEAAPLLIAKFSRLAAQMRSSLVVSDDLNKLARVVLDLRGMQAEQTTLLKGMSTRLSDLDPVLTEWKLKQETVRVVTRAESFVKRWWPAIAAVITALTAIVALIKSGKLPSS